jgi:hypothetical protein
MDKCLRYGLLFLLICSLVNSCSPIPFFTDKETTVVATELNVTSTLPNPTISQTFKAPVHTPFPTQLSATNYPDFPPDNVMIYHPLNIAVQLLNSTMPPDDLIIGSDPSFIYHFNPTIHKENLPDTSCLSASPDGKWFVYCPLSEDTPARRWLIAESYDRKQKKTVPMDMDLLFFNAYLWLDQRRLIFPRVPRLNSFRPYSMVVMNPFTGEQFELSSNYPGLKLFYTGPAPMEFGYSDVVYDPSLSLVIYPQWGEQNYYVLWNRQKETEVAKVEDKGILGHYPLWSPDGKQFAVAIKHESGNEKANHTEDWVLMSREGQTERLTHFSDYFTKAQIGSANWSPDSQKLAFWINTEKGLCTGQRLAILDVPTKRVTNLCVPGSYHGDAPPPVWSLDSHYVAVRNTEENSFRFILVNIEEEWAAKISDSDSGEPLGWIKRVP